MARTSPLPSSRARWSWWTSGPPGAGRANTRSRAMASGLLDDRAFTKSWINYRLARPFGFRRIIQELKAKGIDQEIIEQAVAEVEGVIARRMWP